MKISWLENTKHQHLVERLWILIVIIWGCIKAVVIKDVFGKYGINTWVYLAIDLGIAVPYALSTARFVIFGLEKKWQKAWPYGIAAIIFHFIPDIYVLADTHSVPKVIYFLFGATVIVFTYLGYRNVRGQIRK
jgi:hypothetical protein